MCRTLLVAIALGLAACGDTAAPTTPTAVSDAFGAAVKAPADRAPRRAVRGPVQVEAESVTDSKVAVRLRFLGDAVDVRVRVYGTDGLTVLSDDVPYENHTSLSGDVLEFDVEHGSIGDTHRNLVVQVEGTFAGRHYSVVRSLTLGPALPERADEVETTTVGGESVRIRRMPAREKRR